MGARKKDPLEKTDASDKGFLTANLALGGNSMSVWKSVRGRS